jgi:hypothetical protein
LSSNAYEKHIEKAQQGVFEQGSHTHHNMHGSGCVSEGRIASRGNYLPQREKKMKKKARKVKKIIFHA